MMRREVGRRQAVRRLVALGLSTQAGLLGGLARTTGLGAPGWLVGGVAGLLLNAAVARGLRASERPGPADVVTLTRATLGCAVAGLVADGFGRQGQPRVLVPLATAALVLDAVDGAVARRTRSSTFGARFDGEVDAFLILALSVHAGRTHGWWVLSGGLARYVFGASAWPLPWLGRQLPARYWRKVATAGEGIALTAAAAAILPHRATRVVLAGGLALIAESFGRDVLWLWRRRSLPA